MYAAVGAALYGQDGLLRQPLRQHLEGRLEVLAGQRLAARHRFEGHGLAVGPIDALEGHHWCGRGLRALALQPRNKLLQRPIKIAVSALIKRHTRCSRHVPETLKNLWRTLAPKMSFRPTAGARQA